MKFLIAVIIAILSGLGIGGGGLFTLYMRFASEAPQQSIQAMGLLFFIFASGAAMLLHIFHRKIHLGAVGLTLLFGAAGSFIGTQAAASLDGKILARIFGIVLICVGGIGLVGFFKNRQRNDGK